MSWLPRLVLFMVLVGIAGRGQADEVKAPSLSPAAPLPAAPVVPVVAGGAPVPGSSAEAAKVPPVLNETQQYCSNIAAAAADARFAWQRRQLSDLQAALKQRVDELDQKEAELKAVIARRDEMMKKATETVVGIYAHMKPDAAAAQLAALDDQAAAAILAQLTQQKASVILNEIPSEKAAKLVTAITAVTTEKKS